MFRNNDIFYSIIIMCYICLILGLVWLIYDTAQPKEYFLIRKRQIKVIKTTATDSFGNVTVKLDTINVKSPEYELVEKE